MWIIFKQDSIALKAHAIYLVAKATFISKVHIFGFPSSPISHQSIEIQENREVSRNQFFRKTALLKCAWSVILLKIYFWRSVQRQFLNPENRFLTFSCILGNNYPGNRFFGSVKNDLQSLERFFISHKVQPLHLNFSCHVVTSII